jgi:hypothetical protein
VQLTALRLVVRVEPRHSGGGMPTAEAYYLGKEIEILCHFNVGAETLANFGKEGRPEPIAAKISQETLAEMIGTTRARELFHEQVSKAGLD